MSRKKETVSFSLGSRVKDRVDLATATVDCSKLFRIEENEGATTPNRQIFKLRHNKSGILDLTPLDPLRCKNPEQRYDFLPKNIYVRQIMQEMFNKIVHPTGDVHYGIIFGSPGVGKSVLAFLAALCYACFVKEKPVLFLRKTTKSSECVSVFWVTPSGNHNGQEVSVRFDRYVNNTTDLPSLEDGMLRHVIFKQDVERGDYSKARKADLYMRTICDGPLHNSNDHISGSDVVTSCGYKLPKDEAIGENIDFPLSVWTLKETIQACRYLFNAKAGEVKEVFDVCGGNIRRVESFFAGQGDHHEPVLSKEMSRETRLNELRDNLCNIVKNGGSLEKLKLALESTELTDGGCSIDRLRAMVAVPMGFGLYNTVQYIGSPFLLRLIRSKISLDETISALGHAKSSGMASLYGWHFELYGRKVFQITHESQMKSKQMGNHHSPPFCIPFHIAVHGCNATGKDSVQVLDRENLYWTPSASNFANIDAAIAVDQILYCIQYTVSRSHSFNYRTFFVNFWSRLPSHFRGSIQEVIVVFVVPSGEDQRFTKVFLPKSQQDLVKTRITCANGIIAVYKKARSEKGDGENEGDGMMEEDYVEHGADDDMDESLSDDDCGEEGFDEENQTGPAMDAGPHIRFQWETLDENFDVERKAPLSFMATSGKTQPTSCTASEKKEVNKQAEETK